MAKASTSARIYRLSTGTRASWGGTLTDGVQVAAAPTGLTELTQVRGDIGHTHETTAAEIDLKGRDETMYEPTIRKQGFAFKHVYDTTDAHWTALQTAWINKTAVSMLFIDDPITVVGAQGYWADFKVFKFAKGEDLGDVQMTDIELKPCISAVNPERIQIAAP